MFGKLNLVFQDLLIARSAVAQIFVEKIVKAEDLIAGEADKEKQAMEGIIIKHKGKTGFLYCPRCGLRRPKSEDLGYYGGHCPYCGSIMIDEGSLPYKAKINLKYKTILKFK